MLFIDNLMVTLKRLKTSVSTMDGTLMGDERGSKGIDVVLVDSCALSQNLFKELVVVVQVSQESKLACCINPTTPLVET